MLHPGAPANPCFGALDELHILLYFPQLLRLQQKEKRVTYAKVTRLSMKLFYDYSTQSAMNRLVS